MNNRLTVSRQEQPKDHKAKGKIAHRGELRPSGSCLRGRHERCYAASCSCPCHRSGA